IVGAILLSLNLSPINDLPMVAFPLVFASSAVSIFLGIRFGFIALMFSVFASAMLNGFPVILSFSWYAGPGMFAVASILVLAVWAFYTSLGGQKIFQDNLLEDG